MINWYSIGMIDSQYVEPVQFDAKWGTSSQLNTWQLVLNVYLPETHLDIGISYFYVHGYSVVTAPTRAVPTMQ